MVKMLITTGLVTVEKREEYTSFKLWFQINYPQSRKQFKHEYINRNK